MCPQCPSFPRESSLTVRIYALSKQLNVDSKDILDAAKHLGIEGKSSPLHSLSSDELDQVKGWLNAQKASKASQSTASVFQRPPVVDGRVRNLDAPVKPAPPVKEPATPPPAPEPESATPTPEATPSQDAGRQDIGQQNTGQSPKHKPLPTPIQPVIMPKTVLPPPLGRVELPTKSSKKHGKDKGKDKGKGKDKSKSGDQPRVP